jgi:hypothetical protein
MEMGYNPALYPEIVHLESAQTPRTDCLVYRRVNGAWPYLAAGIYRDSTLTQQGTAGVLKKNGATLISQPGRMTYLQTEPVTGTTTGYNPLPDATLWTMETPEGITVEADGRVALLCVAVNAKKNTIWLDYGIRPGDTTEGFATALMVTGMKEPPTVIRDGVALNAEMIMQNAEMGKPVYIIPLNGTLTIEEVAAVPGKCATIRGKLDELLASAKNGMQQNFLHDWYVVGPFNNVGSLWNDALCVSYPPKDGPFDRNAEFGNAKEAIPANFNAELAGDQGGKAEGRKVKWFRWLEDGAPSTGTGPVDLSQKLYPNKVATAYAYTEITSDEEREVYLYVGSDQRFIVWLNGEQIYRANVYRAAIPDQDCIAVTLKKGVNTVMVESSCGWEGFAFFFRLGDEYGMPITDGIEYGVK